MEWKVLSHHRSTRHHSEEQYLSSQNVLNGELGGPSIRYPSGIHRYNFICVLPDRLPGSLKTNEAEIKYKVKVVVEIPWGADVTSSLPFEVVNELNLNQPHLAPHPVQAEKWKTFWNLGCGSQEAKLSASIPRDGFIPGEEIEISCLIDNRSRVNFDGIYYELERKVTATATSPHTSQRETFIRQTAGEHYFEESTKNKITRFTGRLIVPLTCPVTNHLASCIHNEYRINVEFRVIGCHSNVTLELPVRIGSRSHDNGSSRHLRSHEILQQCLRGNMTNDMRESLFPREDTKSEVIDPLPVGVLEEVIFV